MARQNNPSKKIFIITIFIIVIVALGVGGFFAIRSLLNKKANYKINNAQNSQIKLDNFMQSKEAEPTTAIAKSFNEDFKSIFDSIFGGSKLKDFFSTESSETLNYVVKRKISENDARQIGALLETKGYVKNSAKTENSSYLYEFSKEISGKTYKVSMQIYLETTQYDFEQEIVEVTITKTME